MFRRQVEQHLQGDEEAQAMDEDYVRALEYGLPPTSFVVHYQEPGEI